MRNVTLGDVAREVGLAKSSVLRYFETREEIYLQITADCWHDWSCAARAELSHAASEPGTVADILTQTLSERPLFCDLLAHTQANLEHNVSTHAVRTLRAGAWAAIEELARGIMVCLPALDEAAAADLILLTSMIAGAIWQRANPPASLAASYQHDPNVRGTFLEFDPSMQNVLQTLIEGTVSAERERILTYVPPADSRRRPESTHSTLPRAVDVNL
ncbi:MAG: TetR family transcriptional regulator [Chloroflexi bacterium]|nr:TetR family transcriptional regulator [Chloroflexota bacterium]